MFGDFDWRSPSRGQRPDDIEGTAHEIRDGDELPQGEEGDRDGDAEGRGTFQG